MANKITKDITITSLLDNKPENWILYNTGSENWVTAALKESGGSSSSGYWAIFTVSAEENPEGTTREANLNFNLNGIGKAAKVSQSGSSLKITLSTDSISYDSIWNDKVSSMIVRATGNRVLTSDNTITLGKLSYDSTLKGALGNEIKINSGELTGTTTVNLSGYDLETTSKSHTIHINDNTSSDPGININNISKSTEQTTKYSYGLGNAYSTSYSLSVNPGNTLNTTVNIVCSKKAKLINYDNVSLSYSSKTWATITKDNGIKVNATGNADDSEASEDTLSIDVSYYNVWIGKITITRVASVITSSNEYYYDLNFTIGSVNDILASGGTSNIPSISNVSQQYKKVVVYNGTKTVTIGPVTIYPGYTAYYGTSDSETAIDPSSTSSSSCQFNGNNLGKVSKSRTRLGYSHIKLVAREDSVEKSVAIYQEANTLGTEEHNIQYYRSISCSSSLSNLSSAEHNNIPINYNSYRTYTLTYTSGTESDPIEEGINSSIISSNTGKCTVSTSLVSGSGTVNISITSNPYTYGQSGYVYIYEDIASNRINWTQAAKTYTYTAIYTSGSPVSSSGGKVYFTLTTDNTGGSWNVNKPAQYSQYIGDLTMTTSTTGYVTINANDTYSDISIPMSFSYTGDYGTGNANAENIVLTKKAYTYSFEPDSYVFPYSSSVSSKTISVTTTDTDYSTWSVTNKPEWIDSIERNLNTYTITVSPSENFDNDDSGSIEFSFNGTSKSFSIGRKKKPTVYSISPSSVTIGYAYPSIAKSIEVLCNNPSAIIDYSKVTYTNTYSWFSVSPSTENNCIYIETAEERTETSSRSGSAEIFYDSNSAGTVSVTQSGKPEGPYYYISKSSTGPFTSSEIIVSLTDTASTTVYLKTTATSGSWSSTVSSYSGVGEPKVTINESSTPVSVDIKAILSFESTTGSYTIKFTHSTGGTCILNVSIKGTPVIE